MMAATFGAVTRSSRTVRRSCMAHVAAAYMLVLVIGPAQREEACTAARFNYSGSPMGSIVFALVGEGGTELSVATVYASLGLPSDSLEESHANLLPSPCSWELFDISTAVAHRRCAKGCI